MVPNRRSGAAERALSLKLWMMPAFLRVFSIWLTETGQPSESNLASRYRYDVIYRFYTRRCHGSRLADTVKRVAQELGGKSANIILGDADFNKAVAQGVQLFSELWAIMCNAPTRILFHHRDMTGC